MLLLFLLLRANQQKIKNHENHDERHERHNRLRQPIGLLRRSGGIASGLPKQ